MSKLKKEFIKSLNENSQSSVQIAVPIEPIEPILNENVKDKRRLSQKMNKSLLISFNECLARNLNSPKSDRTGEQSTPVTTITSLPMSCLDAETGTNTLINIENASQFQQIINERKCK